MLKALFGTNLLSQFELSDRQRTKSSKTSAHLGAPHRYKPTISHQVKRSCYCSINFRIGAEILRACYYN